MMPRQRGSQPLRLAGIAAVLAGILAGAAAAQLPTTGANFGGPDAVENLIESDRATGPRKLEEAVESFREFRDRLAKEEGFAFGADYSAVFMKASESRGSDEASSGMIRLFGSWEIVGRGTPDTGALIFKGEHRHRIGSVPPSDFGFETGYVGLYQPPFSDQGLRLTNLYWRQRLFDRSATVIGGFLDVTDYVDTYALASPWTGFGNLVFSTGSGTIGLPNDAALGVAGGVLLSDTIYGVAGVTDTNAVSTRPFEGFGQVFDESQFFSSLELGWTSSQQRIFLDNIHATLWHTDGSDILGVPQGWGITASASHQFGDWQPFLRGGFSNDAGALLEASVGGGAGYTLADGNGLLAGGLNWGRPNADAFGPGLNDQITAEVFYRWQVAPALAITPDLQVILDPALNPDTNELFVLGLRARLTL